jgi:hypothetical protein
MAFEEEAYLDGNLGSRPETAYDKQRQVKNPDANSMRVDQDYHACRDMSCSPPVSDE